MEVLIKPVLVEKEDVSKLHFPNDSASGTVDTKTLKRKLSRATTLGNIHHGKIKIIFEDDQGLKEVRTTVWAAGEKHIVLKRGVTIPIHRIVDVVL